MWFFWNKLLDYLNDETISLEEKERLIKKRKIRIISEVSTLSSEQVIGYLFDSNIPESAKVIIADQVDELGDTGNTEKDAKLSAITDVFIKRSLDKEELLDTTFCPNELKRIIIDKVYGNNLVDTICRSDLSIMRKKIIIDLDTNEENIVPLLKCDIGTDLKSHILDKKFDNKYLIRRILGECDIEDWIRRKVSTEIDKDNLFTIYDSCNDRGKTYIRDSRNELIDDYINNDVTYDNILDIINDFSTPNDIVGMIYRSRFELLEEAIKKQSTEKIGNTLMASKSGEIIDLIVKHRKNTIYSYVKSLPGEDIIKLLNTKYLPDDIKDDIIEKHSRIIDKAIKNHSFYSVDYLYLQKDSPLPESLKVKLFEEYKSDFEKKYMELSGDTLKNKIAYNDRDWHGLRTLLIELRLDKELLDSILHENWLSDTVCEQLLELKGNLFTELLKEMELNELLTLGNYRITHYMRNKILENNREYVSEKLCEYSNNELYPYFNDRGHLPFVKTIVSEHFGVSEWGNSLDELDNFQRKLLTINYKTIKSFFEKQGIDFNSFLQYGSGSKKHYGWVFRLTDIFEEERIEEFTRVKEYFFNNYYNEYSQNENAVYTISSFLELIDNYCRCRELCMDLVDRNISLTENDKLNLAFLFKHSGADRVKLPECLEELSTYKNALYENVLEEVENSDLGSLKKIFNELVFCEANEIINIIGGTGALRTLKKDNSNSESISLLVDDLMFYSKIIEMVNDTNNSEGLQKLLNYIFTDIETLTKIQNAFFQVEDKVTKLYELDARNNLTSLDEARKLGAIDEELSKKYGGEVFDFSDKNYVLYGHVISYSESFEDLVNGRASGKSNFISLSPVSYRGQKYYWNKDTDILLYDKIPNGSFVCSSIGNIGSNYYISNNSSEIEQINRSQRGILENSAVVSNNSETLLYREGLKPCAFALPGGREPTESEMYYHNTYGIPFVVTQDIMTSIDNPKMIFKGNDVEVVNTSKMDEVLSQITDILMPNVSINKEDEEYTGREVAIFTDPHSMYEPTLAVLEDIRRHGITEIYSLGDNVGLGPNPSEVFDLMEEYGVVSVAGNSEYYNTLGIEPYDYFNYEKARSQRWTESKLGQERIKKLKVYPASIDLMMGDKKIALCHFANDVRWDYHERGTYAYQRNHRNGDGGKQFLYTNSEEYKEDVNSVMSHCDMSNKMFGGFVSSNEEPLFEGKVVTDYDAIIQGHVHFDMIDRVEDTDIYTLRAVGMGYKGDPEDSACYYVLKEKKDGSFEMEKRLVDFNKNSLVSNIHNSGVPDKGHVLSYVMSN